MVFLKLVKQPWSSSMPRPFPGERNGRLELGVLKISTGKCYVRCGWFFSERKGLGRQGAKANYLTRKVYDGVVVYYTDRVIIIVIISFLMVLTS